MKDNPAYRKLLREKGMKATALRQQALALLSAEQEPLSHAEIFNMLTASGNKPDKVTLYRVLSAFSEARIIHEIQGTDGIARFCIHKPYPDGCPGNHPHFLCKNCGRMTCLHDQPLPHVEVPEGTLIESKQLLIVGICPRCAALPRETSSEN